MFDLNKENDLIALQLVLREKETVSIPQLQREYGVSYRVAKPFMDDLIRLSLVESIPDGIEYRVIHKNLIYRKLEKEEMWSIYDDLCLFEIKFLKLVSKFKGLSCEEWEEKDHPRPILANPTAKKIELLLKHRLIQDIDGCLYACISDAALDFLYEVFDRKSSMKQTVEEKKYIQGMFDRFFDTQE